VSMPEWERRMLAHAWPDRPHDEVYPGLWIGGARWGNPPAGAFDVVVSLTPAHEADVRIPKPAHHLRWPLHDEEQEVDPEQLARLVAQVVQWVRQGKRVLVRCFAGLNRSGLVVGCALAELTGLDGPTVIRALRNQRSPIVLINPSFARIVEAIPARPRQETRA
jgi:protein-tyrosine phosphatase